MPTPKAKPTRADCPHESWTESVSGAPLWCNDCGTPLLPNWTGPEPVEPEVDLVNHPPHYSGHPSGVECITITEHMGFCLGNVIKYVWRADLKGGIEDLRKARWYLDREIARREKAAGS